MDKLLVELYVPASNQTFDVSIPASRPLHEVEKLLIRAAVELSGGALAPSPDTLLCDRATGKPLDINHSALALGLKNGSALMLI